MKAKSTLFIRELRHQLSDKQFQKRHTVNFSKRFVRKRIYTFPYVSCMLINRVVKSVSVEIFNFFSSIGREKFSSRQAFSKARLNLKYSAFIELNDRHVSNFYSAGGVALYNYKYLLLAVDGSLLQLPESQEIRTHFGSWKKQTGKSLPMGRASIIYDVLNEQILSSKLETLDKGETSLFKEQYDKLSYSHPTIFLMDRAYPSYDLCCRMVNKGDFFVIRSKKDFCKTMKNFVNSNQSDAKIILRHSVYWDKRGNKVKSQFNKPMEVRAVKIRLSENTEEYIITNLDFEVSKIKELYAKRWGVETRYDYLKNSMEIENFSSKKVEGVCQDFYACILGANLINVIIREAEQELKIKANRANKYGYKINKRAATGILRNEIIELILCAEKPDKKIEMLKQKIKQCKIGILPNRKFERHKFKRSKRKYFFNKKKAI